VRVVALSLALLAGSGGLSISVSSTQAGARPVAMNLRFRAELQCGTAAGPPIVVSLPAGEHVPAAVSRAAVLIDGHPATRVTVSGHRVTIAVARPEVICDVIAPGPIKIAITRGAGLGNPQHAGTYAVFVRRGSLTVSGTLRIGG